MTKNVSFDPVPGLADVVTLRPDRPDLSERFSLGYTACEGLCRLYGLEIR